MSELYDVVAVRMDVLTVRLIGEGKTLPNAEAVVKLAVMRLGVETEFYVEVPAGSYQEGEAWAGKKEVTE